MSDLVVGTYVANIGLATLLFGCLYSLSKVERVPYHFYLLEAACLFLFILFVLSVSVMVVQTREPYELLSVEEVENKKYTTLSIKWVDHFNRERHSTLYIVEGEWFSEDCPRSRVPRLKEMSKSFLWEKGK